MSDTRRVKSDLKRGKRMSSAANEAFDYLNALQQQEYRGWGDTPTAARDRAAKKAGITPAQAERVWKRWQSMKTVNGDVYRALRNAYEATCIKIEHAADRIEARRNAIEETHAPFQSSRPADRRDVAADRRDGTNNR